MEPDRLSVTITNNPSRPICQILNFPDRGADTQRALFLRWHAHHDIAAAHQLVGGHLSLLSEIAMGYSDYGLPLEELIGEAYVGLMHAVCRFDPDRGVSFASYATSWVRAVIQECILHSCAPMKIDGMVECDR